MSGITAVNELAAASVSGGDSQIAATIVTGLKLIHVLQVYTSAMVAIAVYDWLVCLPAEWERIWKREWSLVKALYLWTRYYGLVCFALNLWLFNDNFTYQRCKTLHYLIAATCMWVNLGSEAILAVRTYAFLGKKPIVGYGLLAALLGEVAFLLYVSIAGVYQTPLLVGDRGPCTATDHPGKHVVMGFWLIFVVFDLICTLLTAVKAISLKKLGIKSSIVSIFIREGLLYFVAVASVNVLNAAFMFQANPNIQNINSYLALVLTQVLCCRMVLNLRKPEGGQANFSSTPTGSRHVFHTTGLRSMHTHPSVIPLSNFRSQAYGEDEFSGVKVQVDVERDVERSTDRGHIASDHSSIQKS